MSQTLTKTYWSKDQVERLTIGCSYDYQTKEISQVEVKVWNRISQTGHDMSSVWEQEPFLSLVDDIDWDTIAEEYYYGIDCNKEVIRLPKGKTIIPLASIEQKGGNRGN